MKVLKNSWIIIQLQTPKIRSLCLHPCGLAAHWVTWNKSSDFPGLSFSQWYTEGSVQRAVRSLLDPVSPNLLLSQIGSWIKHNNLVELVNPKISMWFLVERRAYKRQREVKIPAPALPLSSHVWPAQYIHLHRLKYQSSHLLSDDLG